MHQVMRPSHACSSAALTVKMCIQVEHRVAEKVCQVHCCPSTLTTFAFFTQATFKTLESLAERVVEKAGERVAERVGERAAERIGERIGERAGESTIPCLPPPAP